MVATTSWILALWLSACGPSEHDRPKSPETTASSERPLSRAERRRARRTEGAAFGKRMLQQPTAEDPTSIPADARTMRQAISAMDHTSPAMRRATRAVLAEDEVDAHRVAPPGEPFAPVPLPPRDLARRAEAPAPGHTPAPAAGDDAEDDAPQTALTAQLAALGYVDGLVEDDGRATGVTRHDPDAAKGGLYLHTPAGHGVAILMDAQGQELWRWTLDPAEVWPELTGRAARLADWRRAVVLPDGDLIGIWSDIGIVRLDASSRIEWAHHLPVHHDLHVQPDGRILTLTREPRTVPRIREDVPIFEDFVVSLAPDGTVERSFSLLEAYEAHPDFAPLWNQRARSAVDIFHTNSIHVLDRELEGLGFGPGHLLVSMRHLNAIAVVDPTTEEVVFSFQAGFRAQHDPRPTGPNRVLVFDNKGQRGASRLLEFDLQRKRLVWSYKGPRSEPFYTPDCGHAQRLERGHTLVNESAEGRAFEIDPQGRIVWEYRTPWRTREGLVSRFYEFRRLPPDTDLSWRDDHTARHRAGPPGDKPGPDGAEDGADGG